MDGDPAIRLALAIAFVAFAPLAFSFRLRARTAERLDRWQEGAFILFGLRLGALPVAACGMAWMYDPQSLAWSALPLPAWLRWLGVVGVVGAGILVVCTFRALGKNLTDTVVTRKEHTLVVSGPYRYIRHPFYAAFALGLVGATLAMANWLILATGAVPLGFLVARTRIEERKLVERFGAEYQDYMRRVNRFLPRWKS